MIYVLRELETVYYKVGSARNRYQAIRRRMPDIANKRRKALGRYCSLEFVQWADWPYTDEQKIHRYLWRHWIGDEWFSDCQELREVMRYMADGRYFDWCTRFNSAKPDLPPAWHWKNRDRILANWKASDMLI